MNWPRLGSRQARLGGVRRPSQSEVRAAKRRVRERMEVEPARNVPAAQIGRWTLVHRFGVMGKVLPAAEWAAVQARELLARHGVVTHASLDGEVGAWDWGVIYPELQRLEMRGEVRRGYFVEGLAGVQFALPEVVERLRESGGGSTAEGEAAVLMNGCDPACLYGASVENGPITAAGEALAFARLPSTWLTLERGLPSLLIEDNGARLTTMQGGIEGSVVRALRSWVAHVGTFASRVQVTHWNGAPVLNGPGQPLLEAVGFYRDYPGMSWESRSASIP
ncbi:MAG: hypothetical protein IPK16_23710 [Anaerolineales bacterium]|nr:hypothetical protein [Anaerolineales bacterium]